MGWRVGEQPGADGVRGRGSGEGAAAAAAWSERARRHGERGRFKDSADGGAIVFHCGRECDVLSARAKSAEVANGNFIYSAGRHGGSGGAVFGSACRLVSDVLGGAGSNAFPRAKVRGPQSEAAGAGSDDLWILPGAQREVLSIDAALLVRVDARYGGDLPGGVFVGGADQLGAGVGDGSVHRRGKSPGYVAAGIAGGAGIGNCVDGKTGGVAGCFCGGVCADPAG